MGEIRLTLRGLGMWVDRGEYWEILFPAAEQRLRQYFTFHNETLAHHDPILRVDGANTSKGKGRAIDLRGRILDLTDATVKGESRTIKHDWMIGLKLPLDAPARDSSAIATSDRIIGGVRLNKGTLTPLDVVKNVTYGGVSGRDLATKVLWTGVTEDSSPRVYVRLRNGRLAHEGALELRGDTINLAIENLSVADAQDELSKKTRRDVDEDFAALYMLAVHTHSNHFDVPRIPEPHGDPSAEERADDPEHLCSTVYGEDDPPTVASIAADTLTVTHAQGYANSPAPAAAPS